MVPTFVSSETLNEYGLPRNCGGLSLTSTMAISLLNDTVFVSESLIGSSENYSGYHACLASLFLSPLVRYSNVRLYSPVTLMTTSRESSVSRSKLVNSVTTPVDLSTLRCWPLIVYDTLEPSGSMADSL